MQSKFYLLILFLNFIRTSLNPIQPFLEFIVSLAIFSVSLLTLLDLFLKNFIFLSEAIKDVEASLCFLKAILSLLIKLLTLIFQVHRFFLLWFWFGL